MSVRNYTVRWPRFVECFEMAPYTAVWVMVHTLLLIDGVVKDNPQVTEMFCLSVWRACLQKARTCLAGTRISIRHESGALCIPLDGVTLSTYYYSPFIEWKNCIYIIKDEFPIKFITSSYIADLYPPPHHCVLVPTLVNSGRDTVLNYLENARNSVN